jgi:K+ transporter
VLPALLLNYFGQAGLILAHAGSVHQPFYQLAPGMLVYGLVGLATLATIIASQAVISGVFSLTRQLIQLGQMPRMNVIQTSSEEQGQIYIPLINWGMMVATIALVLGFRTSNALASAYGIAVSATMVITTVLAYFVARRFGWSALRAGLITAGLLVVDLAFLGANLFKIEGGGWYPLVVAVLVFTVMTTWARGRVLLRQQLAKDAESIEVLVKRLEQDPPYRIPGTAVFSPATTARPRA